jgi:hypothetical protein
MALRDFIDSNGTPWTAWDIPPARAFQPSRAPESDRRVRAIAGFSPERRTGAERRRRQVPPQLLHGWVCFESNREKRRLIPPPAGWDKASDRELEELCTMATPHAKVQLDGETVQP